MTVHILNGPRLAPAAGGPPRQIVVLIHGYGANGQDLIGLAPEWAQIAPHAAFVAPDAPEPVPGYPAGRQWFPITQMDPTLLARGAEAAAPSLDRFFDRELEQAGLGPDRLVIMGFSQGAMLALHLGARRNPPPAAVLAYSGGILAPPPAGRPLPPIFMCHGDADATVPAEALLASIEMLGALGGRVQWRLEPGVGHGISPNGLAAGARFLMSANEGRFADWIPPIPLDRRA